MAVHLLQEARGRPDAVLFACWASVLEIVGFDVLLEVGEQQLVNGQVGSLRLRQLEK
jgi:hypothetical protein